MPVDGTTDFIPFAIGAGANVESQAEFIAEPSTGTGFQSGLADSRKLNKVWRQSSFIAAGVATFVAQQLAINVADDANLPVFVINLTNAIIHLIGLTQGHMYTYGGDPNGHVAGLAGTAVNPPDFCENFLTGDVYVCTTTGDGPSAHWTLINAVPGAPGVVQSGAVTANNVTSWAGTGAIKDSGVPVANLALLQSAIAQGHVPIEGSTGFVDSGALIGNFVLWGGVSGGTANAQTVTTIPPITSVAPPSLLIFVAGLTNLAAMTIALNGLTAIPVRKPTAAGPVALVQGDVAQNNLIIMAYDSVQYQVILSAPLPGQASTANTGWGKSVITVVNGANPDKSVLINVQGLVLSNAAGATVVCQTLSSTIDFTINGSNGLDQGGIANNSGYYCHVISDGQGNFASLGSLSLTAPTLPPNYAYFAPVAWYPSDGSAKLYRIRKRGRASQYIISPGTNTANFPILKQGPFNGTLTLAGVSGALMPTVVTDARLQLRPADRGDNAVFQTNQSTGPEDTGAAFCFFDDPGGSFGNDDQVIPFTCQLDGNNQIGANLTTSGGVAGRLSLLGFTTEF